MRPEHRILISIALFDEHVSRKDADRMATAGISVFAHRRPTTFSICAQLAAVLVRILRPDYAANARRALLMPDELHSPDATAVGMFVASSGMSRTLAQANGVRTRVSQPCHFIPNGNVERTARIRAGPAPAELLL
jgi:hypothetical protein